MDVDVDSLTQMLAARMAAIVPAGFRVEASDGMLWYSAEDGRFPGQLGDYASPSRSLASSAAAESRAGPQQRSTMTRTSSRSATEICTRWADAALASLAAQSGGSGSSSASNASDGASRQMGPWRANSRRVNMAVAGVSTHRGPGQACHGASLSADGGGPGGPGCRG
jgi:hypothetical protein